MVSHKWFPGILLFLSWTPFTPHCCLQDCILEKEDHRVILLLRLKKQKTKYYPRFFKNWGSELVCVFPMIAADVRLRTHALDLKLPPKANILYLAERFRSISCITPELWFEGFQRKGLWSKNISSKILFGFFLFELTPVNCKSLWKDFQSLLHQVRPNLYHFQPLAARVPCLLNCWHPTPVKKVIIVSPVHKWTSLSHSTKSLTKYWSNSLFFHLLVLQQK